MTASGTGDQAPAGGRLYVVATPIGNLGDVTLRAIETLGAVPLVAAEDTRHSRRLFERHGIASRLVSFHARNATSRLPELVEHLRAGHDLALITDAGTPGVSDPGEDLVRAWAAEGGRVVPIPGPSAVLAAIVASGVAGPRWSFEGFLPRGGRERRDRIGRIAADERGSVLYEAPGRVAGTLAELASACGPDRPGALCRELTKIHEEVVRGTLGELSERAGHGRLTLRGEFAIVVGAWAAHRTGAGVRWPTSADEIAGPGSRRAPDVTPGVGASGPAATLVSGARRGPPAGLAWADALRAARAEVERLVAGGVARGAAARQVARTSGIARRHLYGAPDD